MSSRETVVYFQGVGDEPTEQAQLSERLEPYGFDVLHLPFDWADNDYEQRREEVVEHIRDLERPHLWGESGGGVAAVDIFALYPDLVGRVVAGSTKFSPYELDPDTEKRLSNLMPSSLAMVESLHRIQGKMLQRLLCVYPVKDEVVAPEAAKLQGAQELEVPAWSHIAGIRYTVTDAVPTIAHFLKHGEVGDLV